MSATSPTLKRKTFRTSRLLDFCSQKELVAQTGHDVDDWPRVALKELGDNALDGCEEAGVPPEITAKVDADGITLADNGPGIPEETINGILDYSVRVSSREAYAAPDRGAQGNALMTIVAMPFVLSDDDHGRVDITAHGRRHEITFAIDSIRQQPVISHAANSATNVRTGTTVKVYWPDSASSILTDAKAGFLQLADDFTVLNPHLTLSVDWFGQKQRTKATAPEWKKWVPSKRSPAHWYDLEAFERLVSAYIGHDQDRGDDRSVREFVSAFDGLAGTAKQKTVLETTSLSRTPLSALADGGTLRHDLTKKLLETMQANSKPIKPAALGIIGRDHVAQRFAEFGCEVESFQYKRVTEVDNDGLPVVVETAFGWRGEDSEAGRRIVTGVNWSPGIVNPFRKFGTAYGDGLAALLERQRAGAYEPIVFLLHVVCPRVRYTDRGKSAVAMT